MKGRERERGMALPWAMVLLVMAAGLSAVLLERGRGLAASTDHDGVSLRALYAAEGGLAYARHTLALDPDYRGGTIRVGACRVDVTVAREGEQWDVAVSARPGSVRLDVRLRRTDLLPAIVSWSER